MPDLSNLILNITSRISHQTDFAFASKKGEFANQLQELLSPGRSENTLGEPFHIGLDDDGDIVARIDRSTVFITEDSVNLVGWVATPADLAENSHIASISGILGQVLKLRAPLTLRRFEARIFFNVRLLPRMSSQFLNSRCFSASLKSILGEKAPAATSSFSLSASFGRSEFYDSLELESNPRNIQLRYGREASAEKFSSFYEFLKSSNLRGIVEELEPFISEIVADPRKLLGRVFREPTQNK